MLNYYPFTGTFTGTFLIVFWSHFAVVGWVLNHRLQVLGFFGNSAKMMTVSRGITGTSTGTNFLGCWQFCDTHFRAPVNGNPPPVDS
jgi:hypothetical protein